MPTLYPKHVFWIAVVLLAVIVGGLMVWNHHQAQQDQQQRIDSYRCALGGPCGGQR